MATGQSDQGNSAKGPSSQVTLSGAKLTTKTKQENASYSKGILSHRLESGGLNPKESKQR